MLIFHDLLRHYKRKTSPRYLMKIDLQKAYYMVRWSFVEDILVGFGFPPKFFQMIIIYVTTTRFLVKVNGVVGAILKGKKDYDREILYLHLSLCW